MSIFSRLNVVVIKPLYVCVSAIYVFIHTLYAQVRATANKERSLRALDKLDARLLEDIGLCRVGDKVLSIEDVRAVNDLKTGRKLIKEAPRPVLSKRRLSVSGRRNVSARAKEYELLQKPLE